MTCHACGHDGHPVQRMGDPVEGQPLFRMVSACSRCQAPEAGSHVASAAPSAPVAGPVAAPVAVAPPAAPVDILDAVKARLSLLEAELEGLEAKRAEVAMLRRMLSAATGTLTRSNGASLSH